jgi:DeoR/GlpR family transcriptional regulator of sugar metabolism
MKVFSTTMYLIERHNEILNILDKSGRASVEELMQIFKISGVTLRLDLNKLADQKKIIRTHGGALSLSYKKLTEVPFRERSIQLQDIKSAIGRSAANLINEGDVIYIEGGTTVLSMIPFLKDKQKINVITNSVNAAYKLAHSTSIDVISFGGKLKRETFTLVGYNVDNILDEVHIEKSFLGCAGFTIEEGPTDVNIDEIKLRKVVINKTKNVIILVDSSKWGKVSLTSLMKTEQIHTIVTDKNAPKDMISEIEKMGINVMIAL